MDAHIMRKWILTVVLTIGVVVLNWPVSICYGYTYTYGGQFDLPIPSPAEPEAYLGKCWMQDAVIDVPDHFIIDDIDVAITINHTNVYDLQISLKSPEGLQCWLNSNDLDNNVGENYFLTVFDDEADTPIEQGVAPFTGRFRPLEDYSLSIFDGSDAFGTWRLKIFDWSYDNTGTLDNFEIVITTSTPEPTTIVFLLLGTALTGWIKPCKN
jgi:hypothetical protein